MNLALHGSRLMAGRRSRAALTLCVLVVSAVALRAWRLDVPVLSVDEAESALNALTIVADGVPGDSFLGQPLYENTLVRPWPDNPEYEFKDLSYSDRGLAVYHSWLPLYSIAAAFRLAGVTSEEARRGTPLRDGSQAEISRWTVIPRLPAVGFGALLVVAVWALGWRIHSFPAAIALGLAAAASNFFVFAGRGSRYYSATLTCSALCGLAIWNAWRRGRVSDHALVGLAVGALFHVHFVSAVALSLLYVVAAPLGPRQPGLWLRMLVCGSVSALLILPWAAWSGLLGQATWMPAARDYLDFRMVVGSLPNTNLIVWAELLLGVAWFVAATRRNSRLSDRWRQPIFEAAPGMYFAGAWLTVSYLCFLFLIPAASFFPYRLKLMVAVPGLLVMALFATALGRAVRPASNYLPAAGMAVLLTLSGQLPPRVPDVRDPAFADLIETVRGWQLNPGGRIFASPNDHLLLTYYSGRPVQSIAPVRREWLDGFDSDLLIVEGLQYITPALDEVQEIGRRQGLNWSKRDAAFRAWEAVQVATGTELRTTGANVVPAAGTPDRVDAALIELVHQATREEVSDFVRGTPLGQGRDLATYQDLRDAFFYWFADPQSRTGAALNYRACRTRAYTYLHPSGFALVDCRVSGATPLPQTKLVSGAPWP
jgi:hypothetical protein